MIRVIYDLFSSRHVFEMVAFLLSHSKQSIDYGAEAANYGKASKVFNLMKDLKSQGASCFLLV